MLRKGSYVGISGVIRLSISVITIPVLISTIGTEEYGIWSFSHAIISFLAFLEAGFSNTTTVFLSHAISQKESTDFKKTIASLGTFIFLLATTASSLVLIASNQAISYFPNILDESVGRQIFLFGAVAIWSRLLQQFFIGILQAFEDYKTFSLLNTGQGGLISIGMLIVAAVGGKTSELMFWHAIANLLFLGIYLFISLRQVNIFGNLVYLDRNKFIDILKYVSPLWFSSLGMIFFAQGDRIIVGKLFLPETLGMYSAITDICRQINSISALPIRPLISNLSKKDIVLSSKNKKYSSSKLLTTLNLIRISTQINAILVVFISSSILALLPLIGKIIFNGFDVDQKTYLLSLYAGIMIYSAYSLNAPGYYTLLSFGDVRRSSVVITASSFLSLVLIYLLGIEFGLVGSIIGNSGFLLTLLLSCLSMKNIHENFFSWISWIKMPLLMFGTFVFLTLIFNIVSLKNLIFTNIVLLVPILSFIVLWFLKEYKAYKKQCSVLS